MGMREQITVLLIGIGTILSLFVLFLFVQYGFEIVSLSDIQVAHHIMYFMPFTFPIIVLFLGISGECK